MIKSFSIAASTNEQFFSTHQRAEFFHQKKVRPHQRPVLSWLTLPQAIKYVPIQTVFTSGYRRSMRITVAHNKSKDQIVAAVDHSANDLFKLL